MSSSSAVLTIRQESAFSEYSFAYTDWAQNSSQNWLAGLTSSESQDLQAALADFCQRRTPELFFQIQEILNQFFPQNLLASWSSQPPETLSILTEECWLPWEWVGSREKPLFVLTSLTRELGQRPGTSVDLHQEPVYLVAADTYSKNSGTEEDVNSVWQSLRNSRGKVVDLTSSGSRSQLLEALRGDRFGLVYVACPGLAALEFGGGLIHPQDLNRSERVSPRLAFFHSYVRPLCPDLHLHEAALAWGNALSAHGCEAFVYNLWTDSPTQQRRAAKQFFASLLEGETIGQALLATRRALWEKGCLAAAGYFCMGNSRLKLDQLRPCRVRESTTMPGGLTSVLQLRIANGAEEGRIIPLFTSALRKRGLVMGSAGPRPCDIELGDELPNQTASLRMQDDTLILENLTEAAGLVAVNGLGVRRQLALSGWERLRLGPIEVILEPADGSAQSASQPPSTFCLEVHNGAEVRTEWFTDDFLTVGRGQSSQVGFQDPAVSRNHALLQRSGDALVVSRLGHSVLAVNGVPVEHSQQLHLGDLVQLTDQAFLKVMRIVL